MTELEHRFIIITASDGAFAIDLAVTAPAKVHHLLDIHAEHDAHASLYYARPQHGYASVIGWTLAHRLANTDPDAPGALGLKPPVDVIDAGYKASLSDTRPAIEP